MQGPERTASSIAQHQQAERRQRQLWTVGMGLIVLHMVYFLVPLLPNATVRAWFPVCAFLPPLFALVFLVCVGVWLSHWRRRRQQHDAFVPIPLPEEDHRP